MTTEKRTVLVVDDESTIRDYVRFLLENAGYDVLEADDGGSALKVFAHHHIDLLITDLVMPGKEGLETIMAITAQFPGTRIIAMSGVSNSATYLRLADGLGAHVTLQKPFVKKQVLAAVEEALA